MKQTEKITKASASLKAVAAFTLIAFIFTQTTIPAPTAFAQNSNVPGGDPVPVSTAQVLNGMIAVPPELGKIEESFQGTSGKTILFIQDAHDSLEAQENIAKLIDQFVKENGIKTVFEEGYEGPVPTDKYFGFIKDPKIKEKVAYFLMDHLRLGGAEYAHINRTKDFNLIGADSLELHKENIDQYRLSAAKKDVITKDLKVLEKELKTLADSHFPRELKEWLKTKEQFDSEKIDLFTYLGRTMPLLGKNGAKKSYALMNVILESLRSNDPTVIEKIKHIDAREVFGELARIEQAIAEHYLHNSEDKQLLEYYKILNLLERLNNLQVSQEEYEAVKDSLQTFDAGSLAQFIFSQSPKTLILSRMWEQNIKAAVKFYEVAKSRDKVIEKQFGTFIKNSSETTAVLVFGGFHKGNIKHILEAQGISYLVVSPLITKSSSRHDQFYKQIMTDGRLPFEFPRNLRIATRAESRIQVWDANPSLAGSELRTLIAVAEQMKDSSSADFNLAAEDALKRLTNFVTLRSRIMKARSEARGDNEARRKETLGAGRRIVVFDYDNTLAYRNRPMSDDMADAIVKILISGEDVAILTSRAQASLERSGADIIGALKSAFSRLQIPEEALKEYAKHIWLFTSKGSEKTYYDYKNGDFLGTLDRDYSKMFNEIEREIILKIIHSVIQEEDINKNLKETNALESFKQPGGDGYTNIVARFKTGGMTKENKLKIESMIRKRILMDERLPAEISVMALGDTIGINPKGKGTAVHHMLDEMQYAALAYYGDEPLAGDKPVFDLLKKYSPDRLTCTGVENPDRTLRFLSYRLNNRSNFDSNAAIADPIDRILFLAIKAFLKNRGINVQHIHPDAFDVIKNEAGSLATNHVEWVLRSIFGKASSEDLNEEEIRLFIEQAEIEPTIMLYNPVLRKGNAVHTYKLKKDTPIKCGIRTYSPVVGEAMVAQLLEGLNQTFDIEALIQRYKGEGKRLSVLGKYTGGLVPGLLVAQKLNLPFDTLTKFPYPFDTSSLPVIEVNEPSIEGTGPGYKAYAIAHPGAGVIIIDDEATKGDVLINTKRAIKSFDMQVEASAVLLQSSEKAGSRMKEEGGRYYAVTSKDFDQIPELESPMHIPYKRVRVLSGQKIFNTKDLPRSPMPIKAYPGRTAASANQVFVDHPMRGMTMAVEPELYSSVARSMEQAIVAIVGSVEDARKEYYKKGKTLYILGLTPSGLYPALAASEVTRMPLIGVTNQLEPRGYSGSVTDYFNLDGYDYSIYNLEKGDGVVLVTGEITDGEEQLRVIKSLRDKGVTVVGVISVLENSYYDGRKRIATSTGIEIISLTTHSSNEFLKHPNVWNSAWNSLKYAITELEKAIKSTTGEATIDEVFISPSFFTAEVLTRRIIVLVRGIEQQDLNEYIAPFLKWLEMPGSNLPFRWADKVYLVGMVGAAVELKKQNGLNIYQNGRFKPMHQVIEGDSRIDVFNEFKKVEGLGTNKNLVFVVKDQKKNIAITEERRRYLEAEKRGESQTLFIPLREKINDGFVAVSQLDANVGMSKPLWNHSGPEPRGFATNGEVAALAFLNEILIIDPRNGNILKRIRKSIFRGIHTVEFSKNDPSKILIANSGFDNIVELDINTETIVWQWDAWKNQCGKNNFGIRLTSKDDPLELASNEKVIGLDEVVQAMRESKRPPEGQHWVVQIDRKGVTNPLGLEKWQRVAEPNFASYGRTADEIMATFFASNEAVIINRKTGKVTPIREGLGKPHGVIPYKDGFVVTDTRNGQVLLLDKALKVRKAYDFSTMPLAVGRSEKQLEWLQYTSPIAGGRLLASVDSKRSKIYIWDPDGAVYSEYPYDNSWVIQSILPFDMDVANNTPMNAQSRSEMRGPLSKEFDKSHGKNIRILGAGEIHAEYDAEHDILVVSKKSEFEKRKKPMDFFSAALLNTHVKKLRSIRNPHKGSWEFHRAKSNNLAYIKADCVSISAADSKNTILFADSGIVILDKVSDIEIIKNGSAISIYGSSHFEEAKREILTRLKSKTLIYRRPTHVLERIKIPKISEVELKRLFKTYYDLEILSAKKLEGGKTKDSIFLAECKDGSKLIFKYMGRNRERALLLAQIASYSGGVFPKPLPLIHPGEGTQSEFLLNIEGAYFVSEEFVEHSPSPLMDSEFFSLFGKAAGRFHNVMKDLQIKVPFLTDQLPDEHFWQIIEDVMGLDFELVRNSLENRRGPKTASEESLMRNYDFIVSQIALIKEGDLYQKFESLSRQVVHRDLTTVNAFLKNDSMRVIDLETLMMAPRALEFPLMLVGRGSGKTFEYEEGSFSKLVEGYNSTVNEKLTSEEINVINLLVRHFFLLYLVVDLVRNPRNDAKHLEGIIKSFRRFCEDNPLDTKMPKYIPFQIAYPLEIFDQNSGVGSVSLKNLPDVERRLKRNIYYANATSGKKPQMVKTLSELEDLIPYVIDYMHHKYPQLEVINISLFGSYLSMDAPGDIDLLIIVKGNHFLLDEIPIDLSQLSFGEKIKPSVKQFGFSIKGEDNFVKGVIDEVSSASPEMQRPVLNRTMAALYNRHVVLFGKDFFENKDLLKNNALAQVSDLLMNAYNRYYLNDPKRSLAPANRAKKVLARLYEASLYMNLFFPEMEVSPEEIYKLRLKLEKGEVGFAEVQEVWLRFNKDYEAILSQHSRSYLRIEDQDKSQMADLLKIAKEKIKSGELGAFLPVVARIVDRNGREVVTAARRKFYKSTPYGVQAMHAEMEAIRKAESLGFSDWAHATLYVIMEPCHECAKALVEFYGIKRIVYGIPDPTIAPTAKDKEIYQENGVEISQCPEGAVHQEILNLFSDLSRKGTFDSEFTQRFWAREREITRAYRKEHQASTGEDIQVVFFDAELWTENKADPKKETFLFRHLEWLKQDLNPAKKHVLIVAGNSDQSRRARQKIVREGLFDDSKIVYRSEMRASEPKNIYVFDYDGTLAKTGEALSHEMAILLAGLLMSGNAVCVVAPRPRTSFDNMNVDLGKTIKEALLTLDYSLTEKQMIEYFQNLFLFTGRGAEKYLFAYRGGVINEKEDTEYTQVFSEDEKLGLIKIVNDVLAETNVQRDLAGALGEDFLRHKGTGGLINVRFKFKKDSRGHVLIQEIKKMIQSRITRAGMTKEITTETSDNYVGIGRKNKACVIHHLLTIVGYNKVYYFGDGTIGSDKTVFDLQNIYGQDQLVFDRVYGPQNVLAYFADANKKVPLRHSRGNVLEILKNEQIRNYVKERLEVYWESANLPAVAIAPIVEILAENADNLEDVVDKVQRRFPILIQNDSNYHRSLRKFRNVKVQRLAKRLAPFLKGSVFLDFGGRVTDLSEAILEGNEALQKAIVTDIAPTDKKSSNPKIEFLVQPSLNSTPLEPASVDTVIISEVLHHMDYANRYRFLNHLKDILKPGGHVIVIEDSFPMSRQNFVTDALLNRFLSFTKEERFRILYFFDWFGNRLMRNRRTMPFFYTFETMEHWQKTFQSIGFSKVHMEFVSFDKDNFDLMPPKALFVFEKSSKMNPLFQPRSEMRGNTDHSLQSADGISQSSGVGQSVSDTVQQIDRIPEIAHELKSTDTRYNATVSNPWQILRVKQDLIMVLEQTRIDKLSLEMFRELLVIAGLNNGKLHLVIPDALQGKYSARVSELRKIASVYYGFPQIATSDKVPVIGFSDMEQDTLMAFQRRLDPKLAERVKDSAFGLNQVGSFGVGILYALKDISPNHLTVNQNGFRYDATGRYSSQVLEILKAYTVISTSA